MEYEKLKKILDKKMPDKYRTQPVELHYYKRPFFNNELNFSPYKDILPSEYKYYDLEEHGYMTPSSKGELYIPTILYWINHHKDYHVLSTFFIFTFFHDFKDELYDNKVLNYEEITVWSSRAREELIDEKYETPNKRCKRILPIYHRNGGEEYDKYIHNLNVSDEEELADIILLIFDACLKNFRMEYWCFPDSEYERANGIYRDIMEERWKYISELAGITQGDIDRLS